MLKLDKKTHLTILFTFAVVFIVVYLYYTIRDVRKIQVEVKKLQDELSVVKTLTTTVGSLKTELEDLKNTKHIRTNIDIASLPLVETAMVQETTPASLPMAREDEVSSVDTEEIRDILDNEEAEEAEEVQETTSSSENLPIVDHPHMVEEDTEEETKDQGVEGTIEDVLEGTTITPEILKNMKVEELKELCRTYNLATKGNKNDLLVRIFEHLGMN